MRLLFRSLSFLASISVAPASRLVTYRACFTPPSVLPITLRSSFFCHGRNSCSDARRDLVLKNMHSMRGYACGAILKMTSPEYTRSVLVLSCSGCSCAVVFLWYLCSWIRVHVSVLCSGWQLRCNVHASFGFPMPSFNPLYVCFLGVLCNSSHYFIFSIVGFCSLSQILVEMFLLCKIESKRWRCMDTVDIFCVQSCRRAE